MTGAQFCLSEKAAFEISIFGSLSASVQGRPVAIGGPRQRTILAMLVLSPDRVVSVDSLVNAVWGDRPPASARTQVSICVGALRKAFSAAGLDDAVILTVHPGYRLRIEGGRIDAREFVALVAEAGETARRGLLAEASALYREALALWNGPALAGVGGQLIEDEATRLEEQRLATYEAWTSLELELGHHQDLITDLTSLSGDHPFREQLRYNLMLAQYRSGQRAEVAESFRTWRRQFVQELGLEPSPPIQQLHQAILRNEPKLTLVAEPGAEGPAPVAVQVVPAELPADALAFLGREAELAQLDALLAEKGSDRVMKMKTAFVTGVAGVGKTSLAVHWAHRASAHFPDGQLYADFSGHQGEEQPATPHELLGRFLRGLGVRADQVPADPRERVSLYRSVLAGRKVLVVLDNVGTMSQIMPLLPGSSGCRVLVTSREQLDHLAGVHNAVRINVELMSMPEAVELVGHIAGAERVRADRAAVEELCRQCDRLPLALRIAAARLASKPHWSVRHLVDRLSDECLRLNELSMGGVDIRASFALSYRGLPKEAARLYRLLSLLDVPDFSAWVGAALLGRSVREAENLMEVLVDAHLMAVVGTDTIGMIRYRFHDLLRLYSAERVREEESEPERQQALDRALRTWLTVAVEGHSREYGGDFSIIHGSTLRTQVETNLVDRLLEVPLEWFEVERLSLVSLIRQACRLGKDEVAWDLMISSVVLFETRNYYDDWRELSELALDACRKAGNRRGEAAMCMELASVEMFRRDFERAMPLFNTALRLFDAVQAPGGLVGEPHGRALTLRNMAIIDRVQGNLSLSMSRLQEARATLRDVGDVSAEAHTLGQMAQIEMDLVRPEAAVRLSLEAVRITSGIGGARGAAQALHRLAGAYLLQGDFEAAEEAYGRVLWMVRVRGDSQGEAHALLGLGETRFASGLFAEAEKVLSQALEVTREAGDMFLIARVNLALGRSCRRLHRTAEAEEYLRASEEAFRQLGSAAGEEQAGVELAALSPCRVGGDEGVASPGCGRRRTSGGGRG